MEWTGTIAEVGRAKGEKKGFVHLTMEPRTGKFMYSDGALHAVYVDVLALNPPDDEWAKWTVLRKGDKVVFRTKLIGDPYWSVTLFINDLLILRTEGAQLIRVISDDGKTSEGEDARK